MVAHNWTTYGGLTIYHVGGYGRIHIPTAVLMVALFLSVPIGMLMHKALNVMAEGFLVVLQKMHTQDADTADTPA